MSEMTHSFILFVPTTIQFIQSMEHGGARQDVQIIFRFLHNLITTCKINEINITIIIIIFV